MPEDPKESKREKEDMSDHMRVGELIFECIQRGSRSGGLTSQAVKATAQIIRDEIQYYDSPETRQSRKWDHLVSESLQEVCSALEKIWALNPRGLRLHQITPRKTGASKATTHAILHMTREQLMDVLDKIFGV